MTVDPPHRWLTRVVNARPGEVIALLWSFAYFFCLLAGYYVLRPVRDEMGLAGGIKYLPWLFTATFFVMLAVLPVFGAASKRAPAGWLGSGTAVRPERTKPSNRMGAAET